MMEDGRKMSLIVVVLFGLCLMKNEDSDWDACPVVVGLEKKKGR